MARLRIPTWSDIGADPALMRRLINLWPPFRFAGIRVVELAPDWSRAVVELRLRPLTRNYMGTQFGGSMFAMTDPFSVILLMNRLGPEYLVWDKAAEIDFVAPGRTDVRTTITIPDELVEEMRQAAAEGAPVLRWVQHDILDRREEVVATVRRQLYVRRKGDPDVPAENPRLVSPIDGA